MEVCEMDPVPDYDTTDEIEYFMSWFPWALRGTDWTGTPAYPRSESLTNPPGNSP